MENEKTANAPLLIDLGKCKRKQVKKLRKGEGKLMDKVNEAIDELKASEAIAENAQPIIIVVKEKKRKQKWGI